MRRKHPPTPSPLHLRDNAETALVLARAPPATTGALSADQLLHELQVHQIELEMQNEALRQAQMALEESRDRYVSLYEFAPVGYLTLTNDGLISEINLTGSDLLKDDRVSLIGCRFVPFVTPVWRDNLDERSASIRMRIGSRDEVMIDAPRQHCK